MSNPNWENNSIQFPRLLAEIQELGVFDLLQPDGKRVIDSIAESMDLDSSEVYELVDRAQSEWDTIKSRALYSGLCQQPTTAKHSWLRVSVDDYLKDCPPYDCELDETILAEISAEIVRRFDFTEIYDRIDSICCAILRERGIEPSVPDSDNG